jgi:hypothetical protein
VDQGLQKVCRLAAKMPKKIYDVKPPKVVHKVERQIKETVKENKKTVQRRRRQKERPILIPISITVFVVVLILGVYLYFKLQKADIMIWPKVDTLSFQQTITANKSVDSVDTDNNIIPAQYFQVTKTDSQDFPATGNASNEGRASGIITIYNKFDPPTPLTFKAGTHFMSDSGKLFIASQKIVVPAAKKSGGKIVAGSVQATVQAVEGGSGYNIAPSNFSVPGLKGTSYYYSIYAVSANAMSGGYTGKITKVTDDDIREAKNNLTDKVTSDAISELKNQISSDYVLLDSAVSTDATNVSVSAKTGTVATSFNCQVTVTAKAIAFKKTDLASFGKNYIISQMPQGNVMLDDTFQADYTAVKTDISGGKISLKTNFSSGVYQNIDKNSLSLSLLGENSDQITRTLQSAIGDKITKVQVKFWPFWVFSAPNNQKAVNIYLKFQ